ncbi:MAG TPA: trypsin-like peptidase domain-containing protein [Verrucomicrobiae bacterium]|nr:trypsin-like peptidase domain-containing protein [Verrucomicrobiae bacterium]
MVNVLSKQYASVLAAALIFSANAAEPPDLRRDATVIAVEATMPSVVNISAKTVVRQRGYFFNWWRDNWAPFYQELPPQLSAGSGVIIDEEGYVLTNVHVVEDANEISVKLSDGRVLPAEVLAGTRRSDVALLKIQGKPGEQFKPIKLAADNDLLLGETVIALGNPFGLGGSVSKGILSSKTRRATPTDDPMDMDDWLQTDAAINPGNSGGPLVNLRGELIGLNVAIYREGQGIGFAIPIKRVSEALGELFTPEALKSLWFGARFVASTNLITVRAVEPGSPAEKAGFKKGDVVLRVDDKPAKSIMGVNRELISAGPRKEVAFVLQRDGATQKTSVRLIPETTFFNSALVQKKIGCAVQDMTPEIATRLGRNSLEGVVITAVDSGSPADAAGFKRGYILEAINDAPLTDVTVAARTLHGIQNGGRANVTVYVPRPPRRGVIQLRVR